MKKHEKIERSEKKVEQKKIESIHIEDSLIHIKRFKGTRGRLELYVHNGEFKEWLERVVVLLPLEEGNGNKRLVKKILFYEVEYGLLIQSICRYLFCTRNITRPDNVASFMRDIERRLPKLANKLSQENNLESCWEMAYIKIREDVNQMIDLLPERLKTKP
ncbi:MAG: hypothetical protein R3B45_05320 [Bdellovibrionota bacterium]